MNKSLNLVYGGGSGGFLVFHLLLLTGKFFCIFKQKRAADNQEEFYYQMQNVIEDQWHITEPNLWKTKEHWPDNGSTRTHGIAGHNAIYLSCNKIWQDDDQAHRLLVYTDIDLQLKLSQYKRAGVFLHDLSATENRKKIEIEWSKIYSDVKDPAWPNVGVAEIGTLPAVIVHELTDLHGIDIQEIIDCYHNNRRYLNKQLLAERRSKFSWFNNIQVLPNVKVLAAQCHQSIRLQDIVLTEGRILTDTLELPYYESHRELVSRWLSLHPKDIQQQILTAH